jgi:hypothetical protein
MQDLFIALVFLTFVASPAIVAALPIGGRIKRTEPHVKNMDFLRSSLLASR